MKTFVELLMEASNTTYTENGAVANKSTLDYVLDLFALGASSRALEKTERENLFRAAYAAAPELALRVLFWIGDVRGGAGERDMFKIGLSVLAEKDPAVASAIVKLIPEYARWDYIYVLKGTKAQPAVEALIRAEYERTKGKGQTSLMYKWLKSSNASSKETRALGMWTAKVLGFAHNPMGIHAYQRLLSEKRAALKEAVIERYASSNAWAEIDYEKVPSKANLLYRKAFKRHDGTRYNEFISAVLGGTKTINSSVTFPHEIAYAVAHDMGDPLKYRAMWKALPNYIKDGKPTLVVGDVSGSMLTPISDKTNVNSLAVVHGLGMYTAERLPGPFNGKVIVFSNTAKFVDLYKYGKEVDDMVRAFREYNYVANTDLTAVFKLLLDTAVQYQVPAEQMPARLILISDMQFDECVGMRGFDAIKAKYAQAGYAVPDIIFWHTTARKVQFPVNKNDQGVAVVSGYSPAMLTTLLEGGLGDPVVSMTKVISAERYDAVSQAYQEVQNGAA